MDDTTDNVRGAAGGSAGAVGSQFAACTAAWCAVKMLLGSTAVLPWDVPGDVSILSVGCEQPTEVDDVVLDLSDGGAVYIQVKHGLKFGGEFDKAIRQLVRQFHTDGFSASRSRLVIFTDPGATGTVLALRDILDRRRQLSLPSLSRHSLHNETERSAFPRLLTAVSTAWKEATGATPDDAAMHTFLQVVYLTSRDLLAQDEITTNLELLARVAPAHTGRAAWASLAGETLLAATRRARIGRPQLWSLLREHGVTMHAVLAGDQLLFMRDVLGAMRNDVIRRHIASSSFREASYVARSELDDEFDAFKKNAAKLFVVLGESGHGKSTWCSHVSETISEDVPVLLIPAEHIDPADKSVEITALRLIAAYCVRIGAPPPATGELVEWLQAQTIMIVVDGLDRARKEVLVNIALWMKETAAWLPTSAASLVLTSRPETWTAARSAVQLPEGILHQSAARRDTVFLGLYSEEEAAEAAEKLEAPHLRRYRHPAMLALSVGRARGVPDQYVFHCDIIAEYLERQWDAISGATGKMREAVIHYGKAIAHAFLEAGDGSVEFGTILGVPGYSEQLYEGFRRQNLLVEAQGYLRLAPDEVSEHLQALYLDIPAAIAEVATLLDQPLQLGIIRSAIAQLDRRDPAQAALYLDQLLDVFEQTDESALRKLCVSIMLELKDWGNHVALTERVLAKCTRYTLVLQIDPLAELLGSTRLPAMTRIGLLWRLANVESGYDWRAKHWLTPEYAPNFRITKWAGLMSAAVVAAGAPGLAFLVTQFDSTLDLNCSEANGSDLAKGLFFRIAKVQTGVAMDVLAQSTVRGVSGMCYCLMAHAPGGVLEWMVRQPDVVLPLANATHMLLNIDGKDHKQLYADYAQSLWERAIQPHDQRRLLQALAKCGQFDAARQLAGMQDLYSDEIVALFHFTGDAYAELVKCIVDSVVAGATSEEALHPAMNSVGELAEAEICMLAQLLLDAMPACTALVSSIAHMLEAVLYRKTGWERAATTIALLVDSVLAGPEAGPRRPLIYAATSTVLDPASNHVSEKINLHIVRRLLDTETDDANLRLLGNKLAELPGPPEYALAGLVRIMSDHPDLELAVELGHNSWLPAVQVTRTALGLV